MKHATFVVFIAAIILSSSQALAASKAVKASKDGATGAARQFLREQSISAPGNGNPPAPEAIADRVLTGVIINEEFGYSVAPAGDVNGDGYGDVIVGARGISNGRAYVFFGGLSIDNDADIILTGAAAGDEFGTSVASAGDVNGDGFDDVIVGATGNDAGGSNAGRAYIYFGGTSLNNIADVILTGATASDGFGVSVAAVGDVNGDGFDDVIVGAHRNDAGGSNAGRAYIYYGGSSMDNVSDVTPTGGAAGDEFGYSVAPAGDVNGDGYDDAIVGAYFNDAGGSDAGRAYVYFGSPGMDNTADVILTGVSVDNRFGNSVAMAGDVNGDGYSDVIVGAYFGDPVFSGKAYIYFGGAVMDNSADVTMTGDVHGDRLGTSVAGGGDVNGDGYDDVVIGAPNNNVGGPQGLGRAYVYFGGAAMNNTIDVILTVTGINQYFGESVAMGDVNGDGYSDVMVGTPSALAASPGRVDLYCNSLTGTDIADEFFTGAAASDNLGYSVSRAGDVNGDGFDDVIVGADGNDAGGSNAGRAYIYFGGVNLNSTADVTFNGAAVSDHYGISVAGAGDVNGDGFDDVIVGAYGNDVGGLTAGRAYVYYGGANMDTTADVILTGETAGDQLGYSVSPAGDVNGDGYSDVIVGAYLNDAAGSNAGRAYVYYGGAAMNNVADVTLTGAAAGDQYGLAIGKAGDVNGDGYGDIIVGAYLNDAAGADAGRAYLYFGGTTMDTTKDVIFTGDAIDDRFGISVSTAGDLNGDGYSDVIVGADHDDLGGTDFGSASVFLGGVSMDNISDMNATGTATLDEFGFTVSTAGDVNRDGYSDVVVGAYQNDVAGANAGRAYIFFGGADLDPFPDITMTGAAAGDNFGVSVGAAGDPNGDGFSDVILGALGNDAAGSNAGRAYLYLSSAPPIIPRIVSVTDVPFDQGGHVQVTWIGSGYDARGIAGITDYVVQRSNPPGAGGFSWQNIATLPATQDPSYTYGAETPNDSMQNNSGTYFFRVIARTDNALELWKSNILSGHSTDNLGPASIPNLTAQVQGGPSVKLNWTLNTSDPDLATYAVYRSTTSGFIPSPATFISTTADTPFVDTGLPSVEVLYYKVTARDIHGNEGSPTPEGTGVISVRSPGNLAAAVVNSSRIDLSWNDSSSVEDGMIVERKIGTGSFSNLVTLPPNTLSHIDDSLTDGVQYTYRVHAFQGAINSLNSNQSTGITPMNAPTALDATLTGPDAELTWVDNSGSEIGYRIERKILPAGSFTEIIVVGTDVESFTDTTIVVGSEYVYRVRGFNTLVNSAYSNQDSLNATTTRSISMNTGWNLVSVPLIVVDYTKTILFPSAASDAFAYNNGYVSQSVLANGSGYWMKFASGELVGITGFPITSDTIAVSQGWNLIGSISTSVAVSSIGSIPGGIVASAFYAFGAAGYTVTSTIESGRGYWVKASQNGSLILASALSEASQRIKVVPGTELPPALPESATSKKSSNK